LIIKHDLEVAKKHLRNISDEIITLNKELSEINRKISGKQDKYNELKDTYFKKYGPLFSCRISGVIHEDQDFAENKNDLMICRACDDRTITKDGNAPFHDGVQVKEIIHYI